jgi:hypothetical protein
LLDGGRGYEKIVIIQYQIVFSHSFDTRIIPDYARAFVIVHIRRRNGQRSGARVARYSNGACMANQGVRVEI